MGKKDKKQEADIAAKHAEQRLMAIREFNMNNAGKLWIDPEKTPTEEDVMAAKKEWEDRSKALMEKKDYFIADANNSVRVANFLKEFIKNGFWAGSYFRGVINFNALLEDFLKEANETPKDFVLEYPPMQFCFLMLQNYAGMGLAAAENMAKMWDEYVPIYDTFRTHVEDYQNEVKAIGSLKEKWGMMAQGYYLVILEGKEENGAAPDAPSAEKGCAGTDECKCGVKEDPADECPCDVKCADECPCDVECTDDCKCEAKEDK